MSYDIVEKTLLCLLSCKILILVFKFDGALQNKFSSTFQILKPSYRETPEQKPCEQGGDLFKGNS